MQHNAELNRIVFRHVLCNWKAWNLQAGTGAKRRSVHSFCAGGALGTGKTRFGSELPQALCLAARDSAEPVPVELREALEACQRHSYVIKYAFSLSGELVSPKQPVGPYAAELLWAAYTDAFFGGERMPTPGSDTDEVYAAISRIERRAAKLPSVVAVVVHLDWVQGSRMDGAWLSSLVSELLSPFDGATPPGHGIFPIVYLSGVDALLFQAPPLAQQLVSLPLPIATVDNYIAILRNLLSLAPDWTPQPPLRRALCSIEGPPRLLELLLWAMQGEARLRTDLISTDVDLRLVKEKLDMTWGEAGQVLRTAVASLGHAGLLLRHRDLADLSPAARCVMGHVLLASRLKLDQVLVEEPKRLTTNDAVMAGLAQSVADGSEHRLHWPPLYFWATYKIGSALDAPDLGPPYAISPILHAQEEGPPRNECADIALMCLRVFMAGQLALAPLSVAAPTAAVVCATLGAIVPLVPSCLASVGVEVPVATRLAVRNCPHPVSDAASYERLLTPNTPPPCAWKNVQRAHGPDSLLFLRLAEAAPRELQGPSYLSKNAPTLALLIRSERQPSTEGRRGDATARFALACKKVAGCPFPYLLVVISDSEESPTRADPERAPNEAFVGRDRLGELYGAVLQRMRWHMRGREEDCDA